MKQLTQTDYKKYAKRSTLHKLMSYIFSHNKGIFVISILAVILSALSSISGTMCLQIIIDRYIDPLLTEKIANPDVVTNFSNLLMVIGVLALVFLVGVISTYIYNKLMVRISQKCLKDIRDDMFYHMQSLPISYFDTHTHGKIMSHFTNDTDTLRQFISQALPQIINCAIVVVSSFVAMLVYSWQLALLVVGVTIVDIIFTAIISKKSINYFSKQQTNIADVNGYIEEMLGGQKVIKVFCHEKQAEEGFKEKNDELFRASKNANICSNILMPVLGQMSNILTILVALIGGFMLLGGYAGLTVGIVIAFISLSKSFSMPIQQISQQISLIAMAMAGAKRIFELLDEEPEVDNGYVTLVNAKKNEKGELIECSERTGTFAWKHPHSADGSVTFTELKGDIKLFNVDFGYTKNKIVLHDVSLYAEPGQKIAFVGATGAGKTTITNLLNRFYDLADGKIRFDEININKIKKSDLRRAIGLVLQDTNLFTTTVMENIRYGRLDATDEECIEAAKLAGADNFISNLPYGYNTVLMGAGESLSQGQRQLLSIARAAVSDPPVMILDEATSSIDTRTEKLVQEGMDAIMKGRSTFVIAHRLSTIRNADAIMVLDHGRIIERGNHERLLEKKGTYYQLYTGVFDLE